MPLSIKLDEDLSPTLADLFTSAGHVVRTAREQGWGGVSDADLLRNARAQGEFLVTGDKGFADIRANPPGSHPGILVLRADRDTVSQQRTLLESLLQHTGLEPLQGAVAVMSPAGLRVRRPAQ